eukprot:g607.t1
MDRDRSKLLSAQELGKGIGRLLDGVLHEEELAVLLKQIDTDHSGGISRSEFAAFLKEDTSASAIVRRKSNARPPNSRYDAGSNVGVGKVTHIGAEELQRIKQKLCAASFNARGQDLAGLFNKLDVDHNGRLSNQELGLAIRKQLPGTLDATEVEHLVSQIDTDGSGSVSCDEFVAFCKSKISIETLAAKRQDARQRVVEKARARARAAVASGEARRRQRRATLVAGQAEVDHDETAVEREARRRRQRLQQQLKGEKLRDGRARRATKLVVDPVALVEIIEDAADCAEAAEAADSSKGQPNVEQAGLGPGSEARGRQLQAAGWLSRRIADAKKSSAPLRRALEKLEGPAERYKPGFDLEVQRAFSGGDMDHTQFKRQLIQHLAVRLTPEELGALVHFFAVGGEAGAGRYLHAQGFGDAHAHTEHVARDGAERPRRVICAAFWHYFQRMAVAMKDRKLRRWYRAQRQSEEQQDQRDQQDVLRRYRLLRTMPAAPSHPDLVSALGKLEKAAAFVDSRACPLRTGYLRAFEAKVMNHTEFREQLKRNLGVHLGARELGALATYFDAGVQSGGAPTGEISCSFFVVQFLAMGRAHRKSLSAYGKAMSAYRQQQEGERLLAKREANRVKAQAEVVWPGTEGNRYPAGLGVELLQEPSAGEGGSDSGDGDDARYMCTSSSSGSGSNSNIPLALMDAPTAPPGTPPPESVMGTPSELSMSEAGAGNYVSGVATPAHSDLSTGSAALFAVQAAAHMLARQRQTALAATPAEPVAGPASAGPASAYVRNASFQSDSAGLSSDPTAATRGAATPASLGPNGPPAHGHLQGMQPGRDRDVLVQQLQHTLQQTNAAAERSSADLRAALAAEQGRRASDRRHYEQTIDAMQARELSRFERQQDEAEAAEGGEAAGATGLAREPPATASRRGGGGGAGGGAPAGALTDERSRMRVTINKRDVEVRALQKRLAGFEKEAALVARRAKAELSAALRARDVEVQRLKRKLADRGKQHEREARALRAEVERLRAQGEATEQLLAAAEGARHAQRWAAAPGAAHEQPAQPQWKPEPAPVPRPASPPRASPPQQRSADPEPAHERSDAAPASGRRPKRPAPRPPPTPLAASAGAAVAGSDATPRRAVQRPMWASSPMAQARARIDSDGRVVVETGNTHGGSAVPIQAFLHGVTNGTAH